MDVREKLVELLKKAKAKEQYDFLFGDIGAAIDMPYGAEYYADYLIANGIRLEEKQATSDESKWISVKDRLPSANGKYLCHIFDSSLNNLQFIAMVYYDRGNFVTQSSCVTDCVTHWMPLPEAPKE